MKWLYRFFIVYLWSFCLFGQELDFDLLVDQKLVRSTKQIILPAYPDAFNPSLAKIDAGYILIFRYCPNQYWDPWVNYIGAVLLNDFFDPISEPELLSTGLNCPCIKSQAEDARIFSFQERLYLIYNDNVAINRPWFRDRRDIFIAEIRYTDGHFSLVNPIKMFYQNHYYSQYWQKNWTPFVSSDKLLLSYSINPHEICFPNLHDGACYFCYETTAKIDWNLGILRGSSPAILVDGEYFSFFHSGHQITTSVSEGKPFWHYFMGAYTFSAEPPFEITRISPQPIVGEGFYTLSHHEKKVILPGGFVIRGSSIFVAYGRNDEEMWIAEIDKQALFQSLVRVSKQ